MITTDVENYPGFSEGIQGPDLMVEFRKQAERFGTEFLEAWITSVDLSERPFLLETDNYSISAQTLIIATGASAKWLGIPGEAKVPDGFWRQWRFSLCDLRWTTSRRFATGRWW